MSTTQDTPTGYPRPDDTPDAWDLILARATHDTATLAATVSPLLDEAFAPGTEWPEYGTDSQLSVLYLITDLITYAGAMAAGIAKSGGKTPAEAIAGMRRPGLPDVDDEAALQAYFDGGHGTWDDVADLVMRRMLRKGYTSEQIAEALADARAKLDAGEFDRPDDD